MKRPIIQTILVAGVLWLMTGCSVDRVQIISHPSAAKPGDTIPVIYADIYLIISSTPTTSQAYTRDSLHAAYGLPAGWSVLSSDYYIASNIQLSQMASIMADPTLLATLMQDSLAAYMQRKSPMTKDNGWSGYFSGKTFEAHNTANNDSIPVNGSSTGQWLAFSSKISVSVAKGVKMDTGVALTALPIDSTTRGTIKSLYGTDTIWVKAIPIVCFAQIIAGQATQTDTLLYYSKTGPKPTGGSTFIPNYDKGDMTYVPIDINPNNAVLQPVYGRGDHSLLRVFPGTLTANSQITMSIGAAAAARLSICDAAGSVVRKFESPAHEIIWDGTTAAGSRVQAGTYLVKLESVGSVVTAKVRVLK